MTCTLTDVADVVALPAHLSKFIRLNANHHHTAPRPERAVAGLISLPDDILLLILSLIGVDDILALRMTSKRFSSVTKLRWVWSDALRHHVIERNLPVPASIADLKSLSAKELEVRALHAARFHRNWCSSAPHPKRSIEFQAREVASDEVENAPLADAHPHPITQVLFPTGYNGELVLTVEKLRVVCWEVPFGGSEAFMIAERSVPDGAIIDGLIINDEPDSAAILALVYTQHIPPKLYGNAMSYRTTVESWSLDRFHGCFDVLHSEALSNTTNRRLMPISRMSGDWVLLGDPVALWNCRRRGQYFMLNFANQHPSPVPDSVLSVQLVRDHLLVVRQSHIQLLPVPRFDEAGRQIRPVSTMGAYLHLHEVAKEAVVVVHTMSEQERDDWLFDPVTILMRVSSGGVHTLRKYDILPRPNVVVPPADDDSKEDPIQRAPCSFPAIPTETIPVAPSCSNLVVGRNGKGFWTETRNVTVGHSTFPARCFVGFDVTSHLVPASRATPKAHWQNDLVLRGKELFVSRVGTGEVDQRKYRILATSLEDTVGRIAIGGRDGKVQILDLA